MAEIIKLDKATSIYNLRIGGEQIALRIYYSKTKDRWAMDISNARLGTESNGILINTGEDLLSQSGRIGLEVLIAVSTPEPLLEATIENFSEKVILAYMTLDEFNNSYYDGNAVIREKW